MSPSYTKSVYLMHFWLFLFTPLVSLVFSFTITLSQQLLAVSYSTVDIITYILLLSPKKLPGYSRFFLYEFEKVFLASKKHPVAFLLRSHHINRLFRNTVAHLLKLLIKGLPFLVHIF